MTESEVIFGVLLVNFHHSRGPEVEYSYGLPKDVEAAKIWPYLPFQALPDGSHSFEETFTYFTLVFNEAKNSGPPSDGAAAISRDDVNEYTTLFAISCSRQIRSEELIQREEDVTRSTVQKSIVVVARRPIFGQIKDKLSIITNAFFLQLDFTNRAIIDTLYENLAAMYQLSTPADESHLYVGLCLRKIIHDFGRDTLMILKAILLERKVLIYGSNVEALCNVQFGFIGLIPNLIYNLKDCGSPMLHSYFEDLKVADSFKSSDRQSVLKFLGFPLQLFGEGGFFSPYSPLQQLNDLESPNTKYFVAGTSNSLLLEQSDRICEILVNTNLHSVEIVSSDKSLSNALQLSSQDKRWIDSITSIVSDTWNEDDHTTPKNMRFEGSEDFLRWQFEDYLTGLVSCEKLDSFVKLNAGNDMALRSVPDQWTNTIDSFNANWVNEWRKTNNYRGFDKSTDDRIFDLFPPKHVCNSTDTLASLQQRLSKSFQALRRKERSDSHKSEARLPLERGDNMKQGLTSAISQENDAISWKDYFSRKKKQKRLANSLMSTHSTTSNMGSTPAAISSALLSLGLSHPPLQDDFESTQSNNNTSTGPDTLVGGRDSNKISDEEFEKVESQVSGGEDLETNVWAG
ncbi:LADA_0F02388g1_1 [Lachancea dasiensis]|uniref:LADA_0F02388g1_1 n=1 Tax=Lachancea dasiensis TaxID=1072105 RepID=A0A1G4JJ56_9SACH|nr:LADA_0F02388g1_1 [Lachancea dasiensis]